MDENEVNVNVKNSGKQKKIDKLSLLKTVGDTHEFMPNGEETWPIYMEYLNIYFKANGISSQNEQKITLLSCMGSSTYKLLRKLCAPNLPENVSYKHINKLLMDYYSPQSLIYVKRDEFNNRKQASGESFVAFVADLNGLSEFCGFENREDAMVGQILSGMRDIGLKKYFLRQSKLTLKDVKQKGIASDQAYKDALKMGKSAVESTQKNQRIEQDRNEQNVYTNVQVDVSVTSSNEEGYLQHCYRCGDWHSRNQCLVINKTCNYCKKKGHVIQMCNKLKAKRARDDEEEEEEANDECCIIL